MDFFRSAVISRLSRAFGNSSFIGFGLNNLFNIRFSPASEDEHVLAYSTDNLVLLFLRSAVYNHIALGKILALSLIALLAGASNALGTILSLPQMMGDAVSGSITVCGNTLCWQW